MAVSSNTGNSERSILDFFEIEQDLCTGPTFAVHIVHRKKDHAPFVLKAVSLLGLQDTDRERVVFDSMRWQGTSHPRLLKVLDVIEEPGFIYTLYENVAGNDLYSALLVQRSMAEPLAKAIASAMLSAMAYFHSKGIIHGNIDPSNIVFTTRSKTTGWTHSAKLASFTEYDKFPGTRLTREVDFRDLAFTMMWLMLVPQRQVDDISRATFSLAFLEAPGWAHLSQEAADLIRCLWAANGETDANDLLQHAWFRAVTNDPQDLTWSPRRLPKQPVMREWIWKKNVNKDSLGRRRWKRVLAELHPTAILFYENLPEPNATTTTTTPATEKKEDQPNQHSNKIFQEQPTDNISSLPTAVAITDCGCIEIPSLSHKFVFAIRNMLTQTNLVYLRCNSEAEEQRWRTAINAQLSADNTAAQQLALSTALNFLTPAFTEPIDAAGELKLGIGNGGIVVRVEDNDTEDPSLSRRRSKASMTDSRIHSERSSFSDVSFSTHATTAELTHPAELWNSRSQQLDRVLQSGKPCNAPVLPGEDWFIIDATWFKHWLKFVTSSRRMAPPAPINNRWMINPATNAPFRDLVEDTEQQNGDFRRVTPAVWEILEELYGGGPAIWVNGPPLGKTNRWHVHGLDANRKECQPSILAHLKPNPELLPPVQIHFNVQSPSSGNHKRSKSTASTQSKSLDRRHSANDLQMAKPLVDMYETPIVVPNRSGHEIEEKAAEKPSMIVEHKRPVRQSKEAEVFVQLGSAYQRARNAVK